MTTRFTRRQAMTFLMGSSLLLTGCGFHLRGSFEPPFDTLYLRLPENERLTNRITRAVRAGSSVRLVDSAQAADAVFEITNVSTNRDILSINDQGKAREYELTLSITFRVSNPHGPDWLEKTTLMTTREITYSESEFLARDREEALLYQNMEEDLVQQIIRYLAAIPPQEKKK